MMRIHELRLLDRFVGSALCGVLTLAAAFGRRFRQLPREKPEPHAVKTILVIKFWGMGSIVLARQFCSGLRRQFPHARLVAVTLRQHRPVFEMTGLFDEIADIGLGSFFPVIAEASRLLLRLRRRHFDLSFDLEFTSRLCAVFGFLVHARERVGFTYEGCWRGGLFTRTVRFLEDQKLTESYLQLGQTVSDRIVEAVSMPLRLRESDKRSVQALLLQQGIEPGQTLVGMNINASELCLLRRWPRDYFTALADLLIRRYGVCVVFTGAAEDRSYVAEAVKMVQERRRVIDLSGQLSLEEYACLLRVLKLFITNDSGPLHLAAGLDVPTVSFFGPETPLIYGPQGPQHSVFYKRTQCSPCIRIRKYKYSVCRFRQQCLRRISPQEVMDEIAGKRIL